MQTIPGSVPIVRTVPYNNGLRRMHVVFDSTYRNNPQSGLLAVDTNDKPEVSIARFARDTPFLIFASSFVCNPLARKSDMRESLCAP
jgi:hypothetical protein